MTVAVVTGGSRGIGRATATALAAEGFDVLVTGRSHDALKEVAADPNMHAVAGDVRDPIHARHVMEVAVDLGRLGLLVNNAGMDGGAPFGLMLLANAVLLAEARSELAALADTALTFDGSIEYERVLLELDELHGGLFPPTHGRPRRRATCPL